jgi:diadenosine tetraphosphate (Ap4A) HIT family hydrolase
MALIYEARHFVLKTLDRPHVSRSDGGHVVIDPKVPVEDRTQLTPEQAIELVKLTMVGGEALKTVLSRKGIDIGRINYQDNGNWRAELHVHLYGRARNARLQPWGHALAFPPTREAFIREMGDLEPLQAEDIAELRAEIARLLATDKYRNFG